MNEVGREKKLETMIVRLWHKLGMPAADIEVWPVPRPMGGVCLCVNFLPVDENQAESMVRAAVFHLVRSGVVKRFGGLQFAVNRLVSGPTQIAVVVRYYFDAERLRSLARDPSSIPKSSLDTLVTNKAVHSMPGQRSAPPTSSD